MEHGIDAYFLERMRFQRRLGGTIVAVCVGSIALQIALLALQHTDLDERLTAKFPMLHWGYEGPEQYVRRIELKSDAGPAATHSGAIAEYVPASRRGGSTTLAKEQHPNAPPRFEPPREDEGNSEVDREARARAHLLNVPLVRSEDLIIDRLVRPQYPEEARARNLEGQVAVLALVDTTGAISNVEVMGAGAMASLEQAAQEAVWKCRFKPYLVDGKPQSVYAMFRFAFKIY